MCYTVCTSCGGRKKRVLTPFIPLSIHPSIHPCTVCISTPFSATAITHPRPNPRPYCRPSYCRLTSGIHVLYYVRSIKHSEKPSIHPFRPVQPGSHAAPRRGVRNQITHNALYCYITDGRLRTRKSKCRVARTVLLCSCVCVTMGDLFISPGQDRP